MPQNLFYPFIENLLHNGVTGGCGGGNYCPGDTVTRAQMAVFLLKAALDRVSCRRPATGTVFADVPARPVRALDRGARRARDHGGLRRRQLLSRTTRCTRQQMAVFLLKTKYGLGLRAARLRRRSSTTSPCPGAVCEFHRGPRRPRASPAAARSPPLYCPASPNLRQQMAVFLVKTFGLELYGELTSGIPDTNPGFFRTGGACRLARAMIRPDLRYSSIQEDYENEASARFARRRRARIVPLAQAPVFSPEFQVNTYTTGNQYGATAANLGPAGNFVVTWNDETGADGDATACAAGCST